MAMFGVFDGHGAEGKVVSNTVCQSLPKILTRLVSGKVGSLVCYLHSDMWSHHAVLGMQGRCSTSVQQGRK